VPVALTPEQAIDSINQVYGRHAGRRAPHAKGIVGPGTFTATPEAPRLTRAAQMQRDATAATVRFSNASGDPDAPDWAPDPRGCAVKLYLADGSRTDIVAISSPRSRPGPRRGSSSSLGHRAPDRPPPGSVRPAAMCSCSTPGGPRTESC
jgi:catalase